MLFAGVTGRVGTWLWIAIGLVAFETIVLFANGIKCPMSPLAEKYGARETDFLYDTFIPERLTRYTVPILLDRGAGRTGPCRPQMDRIVRLSGTP